MQDKAEKKTEKKRSVSFEGSQLLKKAINNSRSRSLSGPSNQGPNCTFFKDVYHLGDKTEGTVIFSKKEEPEQTSQKP